MPTALADVVRFIVDNSAWARIATNPAVRQALELVVDTVSPSSVMVCPPVVAEVGYSARTGADHSRLVSYLGAFPECPLAPTSAETLAIQNALWNAGLVRSVGAMDVLVAAYAVVNEATLLHADSDFEHVARVVPSFSHRWVVPRESL